MSAGCTLEVYFLVHQINAKLLVSVFQFGTGSLLGLRQLGSPNSARYHCVGSLPAEPLVAWLEAAAQELALGPVEHCLSHDEDLQDDPAVKQMLLQAASSGGDAPPRVLALRRATCVEVLTSLCRRHLCDGTPPDTGGNCPVHVEPLFSQNDTSAPGMPQCFRCPGLWFRVLAPWCGAEDGGASGVRVPNAFVATRSSLPDGAACECCTNCRFDSHQRDTAAHIYRDGRGRWLLILSAVVSECAGSTAGLACAAFFQRTSVPPLLGTGCGHTPEERQRRLLRRAALRRLVQGTRWSSASGSSSWWSEAVERTRQLLIAVGHYHPVAASQQAGDTPGHPNPPRLYGLVESAVRSFMAVALHQDTTTGNWLGGVLLQYLFQPPLPPPSPQRDTTAAVTALLRRLHGLLCHRELVMTLCYHTGARRTAEEAAAGGLRGASAMWWESRSPPLPISMDNVFQGEAPAQVEGPVQPTTLLMPSRVLLLPVESTSLSGGAAHISVAASSGGYQHPTPIHLGPGNGERGFRVLLLRVDPFGDWLVSDSGDAASRKLHEYNQRSFLNVYGNDDALAAEKANQWRAQQRHPGRLRERRRRLRETAATHRWPSAGAFVPDSCAESDPDSCSEDDEEPSSWYSQYNAMSAQQQGQREVKKSPPCRTAPSSGAPASSAPDGWFEHLVTLVMEELEEGTDRRATSGGGALVQLKSCVRLMVWCAVHRVRCILTPERLPALFHRLLRSRYAVVAQRVQRHLHSAGEEVMGCHPVCSDLYIVDGLRIDYFDRLRALYALRSTPSEGKDATVPPVLSRDSIRLAGADQHWVSQTTAALRTLEEVLRCGSQGRLWVEQVHLHVTSFFFPPGAPSALPGLPLRLKAVAADEMAAGPASAERCARHFRYRLASTRGPTSELLLCAVVLPPLTDAAALPCVPPCGVLLPASSMAQGRRYESLLLGCAASLWFSIAPGGYCSGWVTGGGVFQIAMAKALRHMVEERRAALPLPLPRDTDAELHLLEVLWRSLLSVPNKIFHRVQQQHSRTAVFQGSPTAAGPRSRWYAWLRQLKASLEGAPGAALPSLRILTPAAELAEWDRCGAACDGDETASEVSLGSLLSLGSTSGEDDRAHDKERRTAGGGAHLGFHHVPFPALLESVEDNCNVVVEVLSAWSRVLEAAGVKAMLTNDAALMLVVTLLRGRLRERQLTYTAPCGFLSLFVVVFYRQLDPIEELTHLSGFISIYIQTNFLFSCSVALCCGCSSPLGISDLFFCLICSHIDRRRRDARYSILLQPKKPLNTESKKRHRFTLKKALLEEIQVRGKKREHVCVWQSHKAIHLRVHASFYLSPHRDRLLGV
eukprot:gene2050-1238_t